MLRTAGAHVSFADPLADSWIVDGEPVPRADPSAATIGTADLVIILQAHSVYQIGEIERSARLLLDTCGATAAGERL
jgi:UDP-N-acetyl-D-mannosaminuronate dehydrogenase